MKFTRILLSSIFLLICGLVFLSASLAVALAKRESFNLPPLTNLVAHSSSTSRMYDGHGLEIGKFAEQNRTPIKIDNIPPMVINAFLSAEDRNYWSHHGIDIGAFMRAMVSNVRNRGSGKRPLGASTITQQVAKNMLVGDSFSLRRKFQEILIALKLDKELGKRKVLELYLNEIYLGQGSYGVAAASEAWFAKPISEITYVEAAFLAGLPKAPSAYDPQRRPDAARSRRAYVLNRMANDNYITHDQADTGIQAPLPNPLGLKLGNAATGWFAEEARREVVQKLGSGALYKGGLTVKTSLEAEYQTAAETALQQGLIAYDHRHGWRGALMNIPNLNTMDTNIWSRALLEIESPIGGNGWRMGVMLGIDKNGNGVMGFTDKTWGILPVESVKWARRAGVKGLENIPKRIMEVLKLGDVVWTSGSLEHLELEQIPLVQGSIVVMQASTGRILAVVGGFDSTTSFNRATQGYRQPGSTFKPIIYMAAFQQGYEPSSPVLDSPIVLDSGPGQRWKPEGGNAMGLITVRKALEASRNLASVRLLNEIGRDMVSEYAMKMGVYDKPLANDAAALGAIETTNLRLTNAYAMIVNGGHKITPSFIDSISNDHENIYTKPLPNETILDVVSAAQMVNVLEGVVRRGTAAASLSKIPFAIAGKTGTTNDDHDAWFVGFTPDIAIGIHVGFDKPLDMGSIETGGLAAAPIFGNLVQALNLIHSIPNEFPIPQGGKIIKIDPNTGEPNKNGISEIVRIK